MQELDSTALLRGEAQSDSVRVRDMDRFCQRLYGYYQEKGFLNFVARRIANIFMFAFTLFFTAFLLLCVNWSDIITGCWSEESCRQTSLFIAAPLTHSLSITRVFLLIYVVLLSIAFGVVSLRNVRELWECLEIRDFYHDKLGLTDCDVASGEWCAVTDRLIDYHKQHSLGPYKLTAHDVANRIMRRDNYLIAMLNRQVLNLTVPILAPYPLLTHTVQANLQLVLLDAMFDSSHHIRSHFLHDVDSLRSRVRWLGVLNLILAPFILAGLLNYLFLKHAEQLRNSPTALSKRQYSKWAMWQFREFNELPHIFERRLNLSVPYADTYVELFPNSLLSNVCRFVTYVSGALVAVMIAIACVSDELIVHIRLPPNETGKNLVWYLAVSMAILTVSRSFITDKQVLAQDPAAVFARVVEHTHYSPNSWKGKYHTRFVCDEFSAFYKLKVLLFVDEVLSIIVTPFVLMFSLADSMGDFVEFVRTFTEELDDVGGDVCSFAMFNFERHGNPQFGAVPHSAGVARTTRDGKMEKSFLSFKANHPESQVPGGEELLHNITKPSMAASIESPIASPSPPALSLPRAPHLMLPPSTTDNRYPLPQQQLHLSNHHANLNSSLAFSLAASQGPHMLSSHMANSMAVGESYFQFLQRYCDEHQEHQHNSPLQSSNFRL
eukprot:c8492_g1_i2.p1 GENE.c8492_g1_i2~~c8492_g1_i2.p1  ORF type:complete len:682 (+),score=139.71 c8492_g1_i2:55-2046(+)